MSTTRASHPSRLLPRSLGVVFLLMGLALLAGGIKLATLGGSLYYLLAGIGLAITAALLLAGRREALSVYGVVLLLSSLWSLVEVGLDWWQLVPRLALWFVLGLVLLLPWLRRPLTQGQPYPLGTGVLSVGVAAAGLMALASQFTQPDTVVGRLDRDTAGTPSTAPAMPDGAWQSYGRTEFGDRYSPLKQITPQNVGKLKLAWTYRTGDIPGPNDPGETTAENTPLKVNGKLYVCTPHSQVIALDPDSGKEIWRFDPKLSTQNAANFKGWAHMTCRGVAYFDTASSQASPVQGRACAKRIYVPTAATRLIALDADTGQQCAGFGDNGQIDLTRNIGSFAPGGYYSTSPPTVAGGLVILFGQVLPLFLTCKVLLI